MGGESNVQAVMRPHKLQTRRRLPCALLVASQTGTAPRKAVRRLGAHLPHHQLAVALCDHVLRPQPQRALGRWGRKWRAFVGDGRRTRARCDPRRLQAVCNSAAICGMGTAGS